MRDCTTEFLRYREIARSIWNQAFWLRPDFSGGFRLGDAIMHYRNACASLFEAIVLVAIGYKGTVTNPYQPGVSLNFQITVSTQGDRWLVSDPPIEYQSLAWKRVSVWPRPGKYQFRFLEFFDWDEQGMADLRYLRVLILHFEDDPQLVGCHALFEVFGTSVWVDEDLLS